MESFMSNYFGPLGKEYCLYFYLMSIMFFIIMVIGVFGIIYALVKKRKEVNTMFFINSAMLITNTLLAYFVNRLLHTMCINSVR
jgi:uncharacterized membrane protein